MGRPALRLLPLPSVAEPLVELLPRGRLVELSGPTLGFGARTTTAVAAVHHAQREGETTAWIQPERGPLFPPDLAESGVDLDALVVVQVPLGADKHTPIKAAELLLRSGAFGLIVVDLSDWGAPPGSGEAWQGRLLGLSRQHNTRVLLLTEKPSHATSLGALVGLRIEPQRERTPQGFAVEAAILKNKTGRTIEAAPMQHRGPWGLR